MLDRTDLIDPADNDLRWGIERMITLEADGQLVDPPEKRKVGGSTPPLPTLPDQYQPRSCRLSRNLGCSRL